MRSNNMMSTLANIGAGVVGGAIGTVVMQKEMGLAQKLPDAFKMPEMTGDPGDFMVKQAERIAKRGLAPEAHQRAASSLHWAYGMSWPAALGLLAPVWPSRSIAGAMLKGAALGAVVWGAGFLGWLPATGLTRGVLHERATRHVTSLLGHVVYGLVAAIPMYLAEQLVPRRRRMFGLF